MTTNAYHRFILIVILTSWYSLTGAQNITTGTITWNSIKAVNQADDKDVIYSCSFKTNGAQSVDWIQGNHVSNFTVASTEGQWTDLAQDGHTTFNVQHGSITGSLQFSRSAGQRYIHLILYVDGKLDQDYIFSITSISPGQ